MNYRTRDTGPDPYRSGDGDADIRQRMRELEDELARLTHEQNSAAAHRRGPEREPAVPPAPGGLTDRLGALGVAPARNASRRGEPSRPGFEDIEQAPDDLGGQIPRPEHNDATALASVRDRIAALSSGPADEPDGSRRPSSSSLQRIGRRLSALSARIEERNDPVPDRSAAALEDQIIGIVEQIEGTIAGSGPEPQGRTDGPDMPVAPESDEDFRKLAERLYRIRANSAAPAPDRNEPPEPGLRDEITRVSRELAELRERVRDDDELARIRGELARVTDLVETSDPWSRPDSPVGEIEARIAALARQFEEVVSKADDSPQIAALETRIAEIAAHIEEALDAPGDDVAIQALEQQISLLASRLEATEQRHGDIQAIEENIAHLFEGIEQSRQFANEAAENAAAHVARSLRETVEGAGSSAATLEALEKGLQSVQKNAENADTRTQKTLEAVHETLKTVIARLAALEAGQDAHVPLTAAAPASDVDIGEPPAGSSEEETGSLLDLGLGKGTGSTDIDTLKLPPVEPSELSGHHDGDAALVAQAAPEDTARDVIPGDDKPGPDPDTGNDPPAPGTVARNEDFIAAARRAARAAVEPPADGPLSRLGGLKPGFLRSNSDDLPGSRATPKKADGAKKKSRFRRKSRSPAGADRGKASPSGSRRPLLMAAVLLLMIGTVSAYSLLGSRGEKLPAPKPDAAPARDKIAPASRALPGTPQERPGTGATPVPGTRDKAARGPGRIDGAAAPGKQVASTPAVASRTVQNARSPMLPADTEITTNSISPTGNWPGGFSLTPIGKGLPVPGTTPVHNGAGSGSDGASAPPSPTMLPRAGKADLASPASGGSDDDITTASISSSQSPNQSLPPEEIGSKPLRTAAASGDPIAQFEIAGRYVEGKTIDQDFRQAAYWYQLAAAQGLAPAQYRLGTLYEKGRGVPPDIPAARIWYQRAAEKGNRKAMHNLAVIYASGSGRDPDFARAAAWFTRAAELGLADSQYNLAILHERGFGVKADLLAAYKWFVLAARTGDKDAGRRAAVLAEKLDPKQLAKMKIEIGTWRPRPLNKAANVVILPNRSWAATPAKPKSDKRGLLSEVQRLLISHGYKVGVADGVMGKQTRRAIRQFQRRYGMTENGLVTPGLVRRLRSVSG